MLIKHENNRNDIVKIGNVELTPHEAEQYYDDGKYIVTYSRIYKLCYDENKGYYGEIIVKDNPGMTRPGRFYAMLPQGVNHLMGKEVVKEMVVRVKPNGRKNKMVLRTESEEPFSYEYALEVYNSDTGRFSWQFDCFRTYEEAISTCNKYASQLSPSEYFVINKITYDSKGNEISVEAVFESRDRIKRKAYEFKNQMQKEAKENEYGEKLYRVYVRTGTAWCDVREVYAYNEQEAIDKVVDRLEKEESNLVADYYDLYDMCDTGETVDEFAEANDLICAGNHGLYVGIDRVELAESRKRNKKESTTVRDTLRKHDNQVKSYRNNINSVKMKKVTKADIKRMIDYGKAESLDDMSESEIKEFRHNNYLDKIFYAMDINGNSVGAVYIDEDGNTYATTKYWIVNLMGW